MLGLGSNLTKGGAGAKTIVTDSLVLKHNYDLNSVQPLSDGAAYFDGTDDFIQLTNAISNNVFSISAWVNVTEDATAKTILDARDGDNDGIAFRVDVNEKLLMQINNSDSAKSSAAQLTVGTWQHVVGTYDGTNIKLYIDGILVETTADAGSSETVSTTTAARIGEFAFGDGYFKGYICNVGIWEAALDQDEVKSIMNKNYAGLSDSEKTSLVSWWNLDSVIPGVSAVYDNHGGEIGQELVSNGDFSNGLTGWVGNPETTLSVSDNELDIQSSSASGEYGAAFCEVNFEAGKTYLIKLTVVSCDVSSHIRIGRSNSPSSYSQHIWGSGDIGVGTHSKLFTPTSSGTYLSIGGRNDVTTLVVDNVSVKLVNGNTGTLS